MESWINVTSLSGLWTKQIKTKLQAAGFAEEELPDDDGCVPSSVYQAVSSGYDLWGRRAIRDEFWRVLEIESGRRYTKRRVNMLLKQADDFIKLRAGVPVTMVSSLEGFAQECARAIDAGNRKKAANLPRRSGKIDELIR